MTYYVDKLFKTAEIRVSGVQTGHSPRPLPSVRSPNSARSVGSFNRLLEKPESNQCRKEHFHRTLQFSNCRLIALLQATFTDKGNRLVLAA